MRSKEGSGLVITILLTLVVMSIGIYTLSKIQPFAENITGLEHSVQARYHAKSGEEVAKLLYYDNLEKSEAVLNDPDFDTFSDTEKSQAFCRTDGQILVNNTQVKEAIQSCIAAQKLNGSTQKEARTYCKSNSGGSYPYENYLPEDYSPSGEDIQIECHGDASDATSAISDETWGIDTIIQSQTSSIPQLCQGDSDISYTTDGDCQNWNRLISGTPVRIDLSNIDGLSLGESSIGTNHSFALRFRLPDLQENESEVLQIDTENKDDPIVVWNVYDDQNAFFPAEPEHAISRRRLAEENSGFLVNWDGNNGQTLDNLSQGLSLGSSQYKGLWEDPTICANADTDPSLGSDHVTMSPDGSCQLSLTAFFKHGLGSCLNRSCFLELRLVGGLQLGVFSGAGDFLPDEYHPDGLLAPLVEYQILVGRSGGASGGEELEINDLRPVITSIGESWGYSVQVETAVQEEVLIPSVSSPIGR